jgi:hypothetical protein
MRRQRFRVIGFYKKTSFVVNDGVYLIPPTFEPITGVPQAIASTGVIPKGSYQGVEMKISAAL